MSDDAIKIYVDAVRKLYQDKAPVVQWAKDHQDVINTSEPLGEVEAHVKKAVEEARRHRDMESLHALDKALYEMECVFQALERGYILENA